MAKVLYPITSCFRKEYTMEGKNANVSGTESENCKSENIPQSLESQPNMLWKVSSGILNIGSGAVGLGVGGLKWAASTTYNVGSGVVSVTQNVMSKAGIPVGNPKPKNKKE